MIRAPAGSEAATLIDYVMLCFREKYDELRMLAAGGAQPNLNLAKIKETTLSIPPAEEMRRIVETVAGVMAACDRVEAEFRRAEQAAAKLVEAVVSEIVV